MNKNKIIPELRFPEFREAGDWEEKKVEEIGETYNGLTGKTAEDFGEGEKYIQYKQIFDNFKIDISECGFVDIKDNEKQNEVQYGDVFFTVSSETLHEVGYSSVLLENISDTYLNSFSFGLRPNSFDEFNPAFAQYLFRSENVRRNIIKLGQGSTRYNMSKVKFMKINVLLPSLDEQQKIADCLSSLDEVIAGHEEKLLALQDHKKGVMQNLFPQNGETKPKYRFPEFKNDPDWKVVKLGTVCNITTGKANVQDHIEGGQYPLFDRSEVIKASNEYLFDGEAVILPGEGMRFVPKYYEGKYNLHQRAYALQEFTINGLYTYFILDYKQKEIARSAVRSTVLSLRLPIIQNFSIEIPSSITEQKKIADCLSSVDDLITEQTERIEQLKLHKRGLMQGLFPKVKE